jgi:fibro-slime domain-containing protein
LRNARDTERTAPSIGADLAYPLWLVLAAVTAAAGCASIKPATGSGGQDGGTDGAPTDAPLRQEVSPNVDAGPIEFSVRGDIGSTGCGSSRVEPDLGEVCDDGNTKTGDGCSADCTMIEKDFACPEPGKPCVYQVKCGDAVLGGNEQCDPPNAGRGCSAACRLEPGYLCDPPGTPSQPATCRKTVCGDGTKEGTEACDDANAIDGDGCGATCTLEPDCASGSCASKCGDGVKLAPEACDDGNTKEGDGCSAGCLMETGFTCLDTTAMPPARLNLLVTYRDFNASPLAMAARHPDFEIFTGDGVTPNLVKTMVAPDGKPAMDGRCTGAAVSVMCPYAQQLTTQANFDQWYHDASTANIKVPGALLLPRMANGSYVYDSAPAGFYPIDGKGWMAPPAREAAITADAVINDGLPHNFGFTTEIHYFFQYRGGESLTFSGDDDVWIFINRRLALDMGGMHTRLERTLNLDQGAANLGLTVGQLYEISLFHAERHSTGSNFRLTLTGFVPTSTSCQAACGDGVLAPSLEQCDDGNTVDGDGCSHACRFEITIP